MAGSATEPCQKSEPPLRPSCSRSRAVVRTIHLRPRIATVGVDEAPSKTVQDHLEAGTWIIGQLHRGAGSVGACREPGVREDPVPPRRRRLRVALPRSDPPRAPRPRQLFKVATGGWQGAGRVDRDNADARGL
eukprot:scaffold90660_cov63-Phaeocystis_antarctica.AAC.2